MKKLLFFALMLAVVVSFSSCDEEFYEEFESECCCCECDEDRDDECDDEEEDFEVKEIKFEDLPNNVQELINTRFGDLEIEEVLLAYDEDGEVIGYAVVFKDGTVAYFDEEGNFEGLEDEEDHDDCDEDRDHEDDDDLEYKELDHDELPDNIRQYLADNYGDLEIEEVIAVYEDDELIGYAIVLEDGSVLYFDEEGNFEGREDEDHDEEDDEEEDRDDNEEDEEETSQG